MRIKAFSIACLSLAITLGGRGSLVAASGGGTSLTSPVTVCIVDPDRTESAIFPVACYIPGKGVHDLDDLDTSKQNFEPGKSYALYSLVGKSLGGVRVSKVTPAMDGYPLMGAVTPNPKSSTLPILAFSQAQAGTLPRPVTIIGNRSPIYERVVSGYLRSIKFTGSYPVLTRILRVDLDGDRTDEVILQAETPFRAGKSFTSLVLVRYVDSKGRVAIHPLMQNLITHANKENAGRHQIAGFADTDRDGLLEMFVRTTHYNLNQLNVWHFKKGRFSNLLQKDF